MKRYIVIVLVAVLVLLSSTAIGCAKKPAEFVFSDLVLTPAEAEVWQEVTATASIKNIGQLEGTSNATFKIDGKELETKSVSVAGGATEKVAFTFKRDVGPSCEVGINELTKTLTVKEGILPKLSIGDKWVVKWKIDAFEYTVTMEVTGEDVTDGKDCYVMQSTFEPAFQGLVSSATIKYEKATMLEVWMQMSGKVNEQAFVSAVGYSHQISGAPLYPAVVGTQHRIETGETTTTTAAGQTQTQTANRITVSKVESIEDIAVPAGTFRCFKIVKYDEKGALLSTSWASDKAKVNVKTVESGTGGISIELLSYNIH
jgi:hypothetical protein